MTFARDITSDFTKQTEQHQMIVLRDDGVYRHIRFKRPGTMCMHFDLITWPGYLCYTGDMGTFVFTRLQDMFQFFRRSDDDRRYRIDFRYWAEKVEGADKSDQVHRFSDERFRAEVRDFFEQRTSDEVWSDAAKADLWKRIEDEVLYELENDGEHGAWVALRQFDHDKQWFFQDWERSCREFSHRFLWCCHALAWSISVYDAAKSAPVTVTPAPALITLPVVDSMPGAPA
jgi:hypothetical protein